VPTLVIHGDEDRIVPITAAGARTAKMIKDARLHVVNGGPHCITWTHAEEVNATVELPGLPALILSGDFCPVPHSSGRAIILVTLESSLFRCCAREANASRRMMPARLSCASKPTAPKRPAICAGC
jgi:hypothetical protein